jgi:hypothetical protein
MKKLLLVLAVLGGQLLAQNTSFNAKRLKAEFVGTIDPAQTTAQALAFIYPTGAPVPGGEGYKDFIASQKVKQNYKNFPVTKSAAKTMTTPTPVKGFGTSLYRLTPAGTPYDYTGGIPNDNAMAISKDGILCAAVNSIFWALDLTTGELLMPGPIGLKSLQQMAGGTAFENYYDPKLIYDPTQDRFVLVFLKDNDAANSRIIVCFSSTNNPADPWHVYRLDGNPLNNNRWTDFPAISLSETGLVVTANLIIPGVSWQVGFDGSVIWHLDKMAGFDGEEVNATVYTQISHNGKFTRNLHAVRGHDNIADQLQFLSNRNFDLQNDTIFLITLNEGQDTTIHTQALVSNIPYGVPPNGKQGDTDTTDATKGLQTNDGRVLGAIQKDDWIQFVSTTAHGNNANAGIYHGFIADAQSSNPKVTARIFYHPDRDYGYPNIAWTGAHPNQIQSLIGFNYTSIEGHPGVGAVQLGNDTSFSDPVDLKAGTTHVDRHSDSYERWGDYFAIQNMYDQQGQIIPSEVWMSGFYGDGPQQNRTYVAQVFGQDTIVPPHPGGGVAYPNPIVEGKLLTVQFNLEQEQNIQAQLFSSNGQFIQNLTSRLLPPGPAELLIDMNGLSQGTYLVRIIGDGGFSKIEKVIKL